MTKRSLAPACLLSLALATTALTVPALSAADNLEAARMQALFQSMTGRVPNSITVSPNGDLYDVTINPSAWFNLIPNNTGTKHQIDPLILSLVPGGNGKWDVLTSGPWKAYLEASNGTVLDVAIGNLEAVGSYDTNLFGFKESKLTISNLIVVNSFRESFPPKNVSTAIAVDKILSTGTTTEAGGGFANGKGQLDVSGIIASFTKAYDNLAEAPNPSEDVNLVINNLNFTSVTTAINTRAVKDLSDWLVANQDSLTSPVMVSEARKKMLAVLPVFANIKSTQSVQGMRINTPFGPATVGTLGLSLDMNGLMTDGKYAQGFSYSGLKLPAKMPVPAWVAPLVPTSFDMFADATGFDLETPAIKFLTEFDPKAANPVPAGSEAQYLQTTVPSGTVTVLVPASGFESALYRVDFEARLDVPVTGAPPAVTALISMKGMDAVVSHMQQAAGTDPMAQQGLAALFAFKGIGRTENGLTKWDVVFGADGKLMVNGTDVTTMMANLK